MELLNEIFIDDDDVIGKWESYDFVKSESLFDINNPLRNSGEYREIYFLPSGQKYWIFEGWTKGKLYTHLGGDEPVICHEYMIKSFDDKKFMFLKSTDGSNVNVLIKISSARYNISEIGHHDYIDFPFITDDKIVGVWKSIDWVHNIDNFEPNKPYSSSLWLKEIHFNTDGSVIRIYHNEKWFDSWTKGFLIDKKKITASAYMIKIINDKEYLFLEWKMGNYVYGGSKPDYYVFTR